MTRDDRFEICRSDYNALPEMEHATSLRLGLNEAILLIEHLGFTPSHSDNGIHAWYGWVTMNTGMMKLGKPFVLTTNQWGDAFVRIDTRTLGRLFPRALQQVIAEHAVPIVQTVKAA